MKLNLKEQAKPKRLTDKELREVLKRAKAKADKMPEEADNCSVEVFCSGKDIAQTSQFKK